MLIEQLKSSLIISCQAPSDSPLHDSSIIAAIAQACVNQGAKGLRIDSPNHIKAVKKLMPDVPVIGLWKQMGLDSCPMVGFEYDELAKIINLPENHLIVLMIVVGKAVEPASPRGGQLPIDKVVFENSF